MNPKYVTSLGTSMKLKLAGVPQESEFYWVEFRIDHKRDDFKLISKNELEKWKHLDHYAAFLSDELGEMLPYCDKKLENGRYFESRKGIASWRVYWTDLHTGRWIVDFEGQTEAEAQGKMVLHLIKENLISFEAKAWESEGV